MLDETRTRIEHSYEIDVYPQAPVLEAGLALTSILSAGKKVARASNATANAIFLGFSWGEYLGYGATLPLTYTVTIPAVVGSATYSVVPLSQTATGVSDLFVMVGSAYGSASKLTNVSNASSYAAVTDNTKYALSADGNSVIVIGTLAGSTLFISQRYTPTYNNLRLVYGDMYLPTSPASLNRIGVIQRGVIFTSNYDTSVDWSTAVDFAAANVVVAGANGRLTLNSTGALCRDTTVVSIPSLSDPWLGLKIEI